MSALQFFLCCAKDAVSGILKSTMTPGQVGCYFMLPRMEWTAQCPVEAKGRRLSVRMGWGIHLFRRLADRLVVTIKRYERTEGRPSNKRMQDETTKFVEHHRAKEGRAAPQLSPQSPGSYPASYPDSYPDSYEDKDGLANDHLSGKGNENSVKPEVSSRAPGTPSPSPSPRLKEREVSPTGSPPLPAGSAAPEDDEEPNKRATRMPADWTLSAEWRSWALEKLVITSADVDRQAAMFADYWRAKPGQQARKLDWFMTWCNWLRRGFADRAPMNFAPTAHKVDKSPPAPFWWRGREDNARKIQDADWEEAIRRFANGLWPVETLGLPDDPNCLVGPVVVKKLNLIERYGKGPHPRVADENHGADE